MVYTDLIEQSSLGLAGLVYRHFGKEVISKLADIPVDHPDMHAVYLQVYKVSVSRLLNFLLVCFMCAGWAIL